MTKQNGARRGNPSRAKTPAAPLSEHERGLIVSREELVVEGSDEVFRRTMYSILKVSSGLESARAGFGAFVGLTAQQYGIVTAISYASAESGISIGGVAEMLQTVSTFVTVEVNKLVGMGLVEKHENPQDRRSILLRLTKKRVGARADAHPLDSDGQRRTVPWLHPR